MTTAFSKYEGLGNDFVILEASAPRRPDPEWARAVCDRHLGIGADGILVVGAFEGRPFMRVTNADGSTPEMCGNGIRCVAVHFENGFAARHGLGRGSYRIDTDAGIHTCTVERLALEPGTPGQTAQVEVEMAVPSLAPEHIPIRAERPVIDEPFTAEGCTLRATAVSVGNPHLVCFDDLGAGSRDLGPCLAADPRLPEGANIGFAQWHPDGSMDLAVLERGAGWTRACGTGACAAAVAAVETGRAEPRRWIEVRLPGGPLQIRVGGPGEPVRMRGPARHVFDGVWPSAPVWR